MNTLNKILTKIAPQDKTELSIHQINLNVTQDAQKVLDEIFSEGGGIETIANKMDGKIVQIKSQLDDLSKLQNDMKDSKNNIESYATDLKQVKKKIETAAKDLGVDVKSIKAYDNLSIGDDEIKERKDEAAFWMKESKKPFKI
tara:strand:- start:69 stop:497 length:429 start_codon:yes stop_codon:yes gene_type:complete